MNQSTQPPLPVPPPVPSGQHRGINLIERAKNIIVNPKKEWDVINAEQPNTQAILMGYVLPLVAIGAVAAFIGYGLIGINVGFGIKWKGTDLGIKYAITVLLSGLVGVYLSAFVIDALAPTFKSEKNFGRSFQLVAYSFTPAWVGGIFNILPSLAIIGALFGLYGLYLLYLGLPTLKKTPKEQQTGYFVLSLVVMIVASFVLALIVGSILASILGVYSPTSTDRLGY
jgi:hypothetical protein